MNRNRAFWSVMGLEVSEDKREIDIIQETKKEPTEKQTISQFIKKYKGCN